MPAGSISAGIFFVKILQWQVRRLNPCRSTPRSVDRNQFDHVEQRFEMRIGQHQPPAPRPDPLDHPRHVAIGVAAIIHRILFVAER